MAIDQTISHYRVLEKLGGGGMGIVYKAHDQRLQRTVALKFLPPEMTRDEDARERFIHEARAASALDHPNICTIHDIDQADDGQTFIVMAYYAGETLKKKIAQGSLPVDEALDYTMQIAEGLSRAYGAGIVHRDIKPANVMVTEEGVAKIVDFGLAKVQDVCLTKTGSTVGTAAYMSPEQTRGEVVDHRTDLWSLGVVLYEMLTGARPFRGDYEQAIVYSILNEEPEPISVLRPEVPASVAQVVEKLLKKERAQRYESITALLEDLEGVRGGPSAAVAQPRVEPASSRRRWIQVGAAAVLLGVLGLVWAFMKFGSTPSVETLEAPPRTAIAVLPFTVRGSEDLAYLEEGMVDLLSPMLDGAGTLRSIDARALLGFIARNPDRVLDPPGGQEIAAHFGAGSFILGTIVNAGTETRLFASLYDADGVELKEAQASFAGEEAFMEAVDALAQQLVSVYLEDVDQRRASLALETTASFPALKAYLEGEQALRRGRVQQAIEAARRAVEADTTFALGWYLLRQSLVWLESSEVGALAEATLALERSLQYSDGLPDRTKTLIQAYAASTKGNVEESERMYRFLLDSYPDDIEAWGKLGDLLYHYNPMRGRPAAEALDAFERVLYYDADNAEYSAHLMDLAGQERDYAVFDSLGTRFLQTEDPYNLMGNLYWLVRGSPQARDSVMALYESAPVAHFIWEWCYLVISDHIDIAQQLAERYGEAAPSSEEQALGKLLYSLASISRGQVERGRAARNAAEQLSPTIIGNSSPVGDVFNILLPYVSVSSEVLDSLEQRVAAWDTTAVPHQDPLQDVGGGAVQYPGHQGDIQAYTLGLLRWRQGDVEGTKAYAEALRRRAHPQARNDLAYSFARTLEGLAAWQEDRPEKALAALEEARLQPTVEEAVLSPIYAQVLARYARAEIHYTQGRFEEALPWYTSLHDGFYTQGLGYLGLSYLRRAEIYEHLRDTENAIQYYTRFLDLWQDADADLQTDWVEPARQRLNRLLSGTVREPVEVARPGESS